MIRHWWIRLQLQTQRGFRGPLFGPALTSNAQFAQDVLSLIWRYKWYSLAILVVTVFQEFAALWPVNLLGDFIDRLEQGNIGNIVWLFLGASLFYPGLVRANVMLRHRMFYRTDFDKMVEMVLRVADQSHNPGPEAAGGAWARVANAVSGVTNATYHVLGSFTPVIIKIVIVSERLLVYNRVLGFTYLASLVIPLVMTFAFNKLLRVLLDSQYSVSSDLAGSAVETICNRRDESVRGRFLEVMRVRRRVLTTLVYKSQFYLYVREAALVGSQFIVVFMALAMRNDIGMTTGDFARVVGYTAQVAAAFISAASCLDAIISYSRAYHIYATARSESV